MIVYLLEALTAKETHVFNCIVRMTENRNVYVRDKISI